MVINQKTNFGKFYVGLNGIAGALNEELIDIKNEKVSELITQTHRRCVCSFRIKLKDSHKNQEEFNRIAEVFKAHNIGYFFIMEEVIRKILQ